MPGDGFEQGVELKGWNARVRAELDAAEEDGHGLHGLGSFRVAHQGLGRGVRRSGSCRVRQKWRHASRRMRTLIVKTVIARSIMVRSFRSLSRRHSLGDRSKTVRWCVRPGR